MPTLGRVDCEVVLRPFLDLILQNHGFSLTPGDLCMVDFPHAQVTCPQCTFSTGLLCAVFLYFP